MSKRRLTRPVGLTFRHLADDKNMLMIAQSLWANIKELIIRSRDVLFTKLHPSELLQLIDIIDDTIDIQIFIASAIL